MIVKKFKETKSWQAFLNYLESKEDFQDKALIKKVVDIVEKESFKDFEWDEKFPLATKKQIQKYKTSKKRTIYMYPEPYNTYLKMINWLLQSDEEYSSKFCINSYAYQKNKSVATGVKALQKALSRKNRSNYIKTDFSDYFNSVDTTVLKKQLDSFIKAEDIVLKEFILRLLEEKNVIINNEIVVEEQKGVMAGTPISGYLANVYMNEVDWQMYRNNIFYIRYADDVFILTQKPSEDLELFSSLIEPLKVKLNASKTSIGLVEDGFAVLGFEFRNGEIDIDEAKVQKMFNRIRRRSKWFRTWEKQNKVKNEVMVRTFIKGMNAKLFAGDEEDRMNWSRWYYPNITTTKNLERIDAYLVQYIRYLISGKHLGYKKHSEVEYSLLKKYGYTSLVNKYWRFKKRGDKNVIQNNNGAKVE